MKEEKVVEGIVGEPDKGPSVKEDTFPMVGLPAVLSGITVAFVLFPGEPSIKR